MNRLMWWFLLLLAESPETQAARVRAQMQESIAAQREAVRKQSERVRPKPVTRPNTLVAREQPACDPVPAPELTTLVDSAAREQNVSPGLIREVARQESGFRPCAVSSQGATGLMQLMPITQIELGVSDPWDARQSIEAGSRLLRQLLDRYHGDVALALSAYNAGASQVDSAGGIPAIPETRNYVDSILYRLVTATHGSVLQGLGGGP